MSLQLSRIQPRRAKFVPPKPSPWGVSRPRLLERLDDARSFPLTIVSAPAGSGKTTVLSEWVRTLDLPWGWLTVDESDAPIDVFLTNLILAMQMAAPGLGESALAVVRLGTDPDLDLVVAELDDGLLVLDTDLVIVIDDLHMVTDRRVLEFFEKLLQYPPPRLHLVLSTRRDPDFPLARLRSRGQVVEIRAVELALTQAETRELLDHAGLAPDLAATLGQCNEGWAVGIHLGALALRARKTSTPSSRDIELLVQAGMHELIVEDILAQQPEPLQRLLLVSSIVERFTADLCETLLEDTVRVLPGGPLLQLQQLAGAGLLLFSLGGDPEWFRYHQIFREVLQAELRKHVDAEELARLNALASAWFDGAGMVSEALTHAIAADRIDDAIAIVERSAQEALATDRWPELAHWLDRLPPAAVRARPELIIAQAWVHQSRGDYPALLSALDRATVLLDASPGVEDATLAAQRVELEVLRLYIQRADLMTDRYIQIGELSIATGPDRFASSFGVCELGFGLLYRGDYDELTARMTAIVEANRGLDDPFARQRELWARQFLAFVPTLRGEWPRTVVEMEAVLELARRYGMLRFAAQVQYVQGWSWYERDGIDEAIRYFSGVLNEHSAGIVVLVNSTLGLVRSLDAAGRSDEAGAMLDRLSMRYEGPNPISYGRPLVASVHALRALESGDVAAATDALRSISVWQPEVDVSEIEQPMLTRIQVSIAAGRLRDAERDLQAVERTAGRPPVRSFEARVAAVRALHAMTAGDRERAVASMRAACALARPGHYVRTILDPGLGSAAFQELLTLIPPDELPISLEALRAYYDTPPPHSSSAMTLSAREAERDRQPLDLLTDRELDVAAALMRRLSYKEIAQELDISPVTVKSHATHLYSKLGVSSRRQMIHLLER